MLLSDAEKHDGEADLGYDEVKLKMHFSVPLAVEEHS